jgi:hypothetical protein
LDCVFDKSDLAHISALLSYLVQPAHRAQGRVSGLLNVQASGDVFVNLRLQMKLKLVTQLLISPLL